MILPAQGTAAAAGKGPGASRGFAAGTKSLCPFIAADQRGFGQVTACVEPRHLPCSASLHRLPASPDGIFHLPGVIFFFSPLSLLFS